MKSRERACLMLENSLYSYLSSRLVTSRLPTGKSGRTCILGHCLRRGLTPAKKGFTILAASDALSFCHRRETMAEAV